MIIAVEFKVNNERAVQFHKWANGIVRDYTIKGWVMDDERLKQETYLAEKYFGEQLECISTKKLYRGFPCQKAGTEQRGNPDVLCRG